MRPKSPKTATPRPPDVSDRDTRSMAHPWFYLNQTRGRSASSLDINAAARQLAKS